MRTEELSRAILDLIKTLIRFEVASQRTDDWGYKAYADICTYIRLISIKETLKDEQNKSKIDWHNSLDISTRKEIGFLQYFSSVEYTINLSEVISIDLDPHLQSHQLNQALDTCEPKDKYQTPSTSELDSS